ncbi:hypothetical protein NBRC116492_27710 [Aurantivibrio infirmus]
MIERMKKILGKNAVKQYFKITFGGTSLLASSICFADGATGTSPINGAYVIQVLLGLALVLLSIFAIAWLVKKFGHGITSSNQNMKIVSQLPVGTREKVIVVEVGEKQIMLGVTAQQINTLQVFDEPAIDTRTKREVSEFSQKILEIMRKGSVK